MLAFFEACNVAFAALCPPPSFPSICGAWPALYVRLPGSIARLPAGHMSASYCGPDCVSCSARSTDEKESTRDERRKARSGTEGMGVARRIFNLRRNNTREPGRTGQAGKAGSQASRHLWRVYSSLNPAAKQSEAAHLARMIRWIACNVHCRDWGERGAYAVMAVWMSLCLKRRLPQGTAGRHRDADCNKAITSFWSCFCCYCESVKCWLLLYSSHAAVHVLVVHVSRT